MERFGPTLKALIKRDFGTDTRFATVVGFSRSQVSHLKRERYKGLSFATMSGFYSVFPFEEDQERLYEAWQTSYAPHPNVLRFEGTKGDVDGYIASVARRIAAGEADSTFQSLRSLWQSAEEVGDLKRLLQLGQPFIETAYLLNRRAEGLRALQVFREIARSSGEHAHVALSFSLEAVGVRPIGPDGPKLAMRALTELDDYLGMWQPFSAEGKEIHGGLSDSLARDRVIVAWEADRLGTGTREELTRSVEGLQKRLDRMEMPAMRAITGEIVARGFAALGDPDAARQAMSDASKLVKRPAPAEQVKQGLTCARIEIADGDPASAWDVLSGVIDLCEKQNLLHHHIEATKLQLELLGRQTGGGR